MQGFQVISYYSNAFVLSLTCFSYFFINLGVKELTEYFNQEHRLGQEIVNILIILQVSSSKN